MRESTLVGILDARSAEYDPTAEEATAMKAIQFKSFGSPDVLELVELPRPTCLERSAMVQVRSSSVNPSDVKNVAGSFGKTTLPRVPGRDFSGVVVEGPASWVGAEVWGTGGDIGFTRDHRCRRRSGRGGCADCKSARLPGHRRGSNPAARGFTRIAAD